MADKPGEIPRPQNAEEALELVDDLVYGVVEYAQTQIESMVNEGATPEEMAELEGIVSRLRGIGEKTLSAASMIEEADIQVNEPEALDEDAAYNKILTYLEEKNVGDMVTDDDILDYLHRRGVDVDSKQLRKWLSAWKGELTVDLKEGGRNVAVEKVPNAREYGLPANTYALAVDYTQPAPRARRPLPVQVPIPPRTVTPRLPVETTPADEERAERLANAARNLVLLEPGLLAATYRKRLAETRGLSATRAEIQLAFEAQLAAGGVHKINQRGHVIYVSEAPQPKAAGPQSGESRRQKQEMSPEDEKLGQAMLDALATLGQKFGQGMIIEDFQRHSSLTGNEGLDLSEAAIRRVINALKKTGAIEATQAKPGHAKPQYRTRAANSGMAKAVRDPDLRQAILAAAKAKQRFELPPDFK